MIRALSFIYRQSSGQSWHFMISVRILSYDCSLGQDRSFANPLVENRISNAQQELEDVKSPESKEHEKAAELAGVTPEEVAKAIREKEEDKDGK